MSDDPADANGSSPRPMTASPEPDAAGQAALLLAESTLHALIEARVLTRDQALATVRTAAAVKVERADEIGERRGTMRASLDLLGRIERSMATIDAAGI